MPTTNSPAEPSLQVLFLPVAPADDAAEDKRNYTTREKVLFDLLSGTTELDESNRGPAAELTKIVLGVLPNSSNGEDDETEEPVINLPTLPANFSTIFPNLTHLYLWRIGEFTALPKLPESLHCLDVRGCPELTSIEQIPQSVQILDLGHCTSLSALPREAPSALQRFYLNRCGSLAPRHVENFLESTVTESASLIEMDASHCPAISSLEFLPRNTLRRLVLEGCENFADATGLDKFQALDHLNLRGCSKLQRLPSLPPALRYLVLYGSDSLRSFAGQDIGPYERGSKPDHNVLPILRSRLKFGSRMGVFPYAKLLFMGDGRVGKSTLAKRLRWEELNKAQRAKRENLRPRGDQPYTHRVEFSLWETGIEPPESASSALVERAQLAGAQIPKTAEDQIQGSVRLWDFGGQELYHTTHRVFAGQGSVFILAWCEEEPDPGTEPEGVTKEEWREWNRQRSLDYWLDYIFDIRPDAKVALVCTKVSDPDTAPRKPDWKTRAPRSADNPTRTEQIEAFHIDSLDEHCGSHRSYRDLVEWIRRACGAEADRIGMLHPAYFGEVGQNLDAILSENATCLLPSEKQLIDLWPNWSERLRSWHQQSADAGVALDASDIDAITSILHQAGQVYRIDHQNESAVLIDQDWAADRIYQLLKPDGELRKIVKENAGWFYRTELERTELWQHLDAKLEKPQLLAFMRECQLLTLLADARASRVGEEVYLASDKWLLPEYIALQDRSKHDETRTRPSQLADARWEATLSSPQTTEREKFAFEEIELTEFEFRALLAYLAGVFGVHATYFRDRMLAIDPDGEPHWAMRLRWLPKEEEGEAPKDAFTGTVDVVLLAREGTMEQFGSKIEQLFADDKSPFAGRYRPPVRERPDEIDLRGEFLMGGRQGEYDFGIGSSGGDLDAVLTMRAALVANDYKTRWYKAPECRLGDEAELRKYMLQFLHEDRLLLVLSDNYLRADPAQNWFCAWELADAMIKLEEGTRTLEKTMIVLITGNEFRSRNFRERVSELLQSMENHFRSLYAEKYNDGKETLFSDYDYLCQRFRDAHSESAFNSFVELCGPDGKAWRYAEISEDDFAPLLEKLSEQIPKHSTRLPPHV